MAQPPPVSDPRAARTRAAILAAFGRLVLTQRYEAIRIAGLIAEAGVGKATFYEHFRGKNDVLLVTMEPVLLALSTAASGRAARSYVRAMMSHMWTQRSTGRAVLGLTTAPLIQRRLADMVRVHVERVDPDATAPAIRATAIAAVQLAMLRAWLSGEISCTVDEITDRMIACAKLIERDW